MKYLAFLLFFLPSTAYACSCLFTATFCEYAAQYVEWTEGETAVVRATYLGFRSPDVDGFAPLYDFRLEGIIGGSLPGVSRFSLWGQDGGNCNGPVAPLEEGEQYIVLFPSREGYTSYFPGLQSGVDNPYPIYDFPGCGPASLKVEAGGSVTGPIAPDLQRVGLASFARELENCLGDKFQEWAGGNGPVLPQPIEADVFPNPANESFTVTFTETPIYDVLLYDLAGRLIWEEQLGGAVRTEHSINVRSLPAGVYFLVMETDGLRIKERVVVL
ncbi:T9SS type A sorting domain-containing protein [Neolewinella lacunae]|uniref:T9SS type A sorting domain-containing protein n=1 Tax=Neolewinella lacunae TaxID=1517758 RepID=A0A923PQ40_9BACT|nr:T9SS type A sorting domain-containing protein [Neolewinella lacunae]MBC6995404.1 T9SS type A sorting domain-containing protein [Neolewinella lacunae]MDN3633853.1 T9SS type A sorting domain-containing protein [Neolewinella lacunae]